MAKCCRCGYCCKVGPCCFGEWDPGKSQCSFLTEDNRCRSYEEIKNLPGAELNPAFGTGCSSTLGNIHRQRILAQRHG